MNGRNGKAHARVVDFRDLDLMLKLQAEGGEAETWELAEALGFAPEREGARQAVGQRLGWMRHFGMLEFDAERRLWRLSKGGERVVQARLKAAASRTIEALDDEQMVDVMAAVTTRYVHGEPMIADLLRREFQFGTARRR